MRFPRLALSLLLLTGGAPTAYAAAPSAPQRLPSQVVGVTGSGEQLSLQVKDGEARRSLKVGDLYEDGWTVKAISPTQATLAKDGVSETVGLNPTGALALTKTDDPATTVKAVGLTPREQLEVLFAEARAKIPALTQLVTEQLGPWDGKTPRMGLSLAETQRYVAYQARGAQVPASGLPGVNGFLSPDQINGLGADVSDYLALNQKLLDGLQDARGYRSNITSRSYAGAPGAAPPAPGPSEDQQLMMRQLLIESNLLVPSVPASRLE